MDDEQTTADTIREAFAAGTALVRARFWRYAGLIIVLMLLFALTGFIRIAAVKTGLWSVMVAFGFLWNLALGIMNVGLYRSFWDGMRGEPVRLKHLFWGFGKSTRWMLPLISTLIWLPLIVQQANNPVPAMIHTPTWAFWLLIPAVLLEIVVGYAYALIVRLDIGPLAALRMAMTIFQKGKRRWLALPFLIMLAAMGAGMLIMLSIGLIALAGKALALSKGMVMVLLMLVAIPIGLGWIFAMFPWMGAIILSASGNLAGGNLQNQ